MSRVDLLSILLRVDRGAYHCLPSRHVRGARRYLFDQAVQTGHLALRPKRGQFPRRYVVTARGSHELGTFAFSEGLR